MTVGEIELGYWLRNGLFQVGRDIAVRHGPGPLHPSCMVLGCSCNARVPAAASQIPPPPREAARASAVASEPRDGGCEPTCRTGTCEPPGCGGHGAPFGAAAASEASGSGGGEAHRCSCSFSRARSFCSRSSLSTRNLQGFMWIT